MAISLKAARINASLTQKEASEKLGVNETTLLNWEKHRSSPTVAQALALCNLYGVSIDDVSFTQ